jgi:hypothetical protein
MIFRLFVRAMSTARVLFFAILGFCSSAEAETSRPAHQVPLKVIRIVTDSKFDRVIEKYREFSDQERFAIIVSPTDPEGHDFLVQMWRQDLKMIGTTLGDAYKVAVFQTTDEAVDSIVVDSIVGKLRTKLETLDAAEVTVTVP